MLLQFLTLKFKLRREGREYFAQINAQWNEINGKTDTGADTSVGSTDHHGKYCSKIELLPVTQKIRLADHNIMMEGKKVSTMDLRVNNTRRD